MPPSSLPEALPLLDSSSLLSPPLPSQSPLPPSLSLSLLLLLASASLAVPGLPVLRRRGGSSGAGQDSMPPTSDGRGRSASAAFALPCNHLRRGHCHLMRRTSAVAVKQELQRGKRSLPGSRLPAGAPQSQQVERAEPVHHRLPRRRNSLEAIEQKPIVAAAATATSHTCSPARPVACLASATCFAAIR